MVSFGINLSAVAERNTMIPKSAPIALHPLFTAAAPGENIACSLTDPVYQAILTVRADLPAVQKYTGLLMHFERTGDPGRRSDMTTSDLSHAKSAMVAAVLESYDAIRKGSPAALRARIAELEERLEHKDVALRAALAREASMKASQKDA
jgi:hypothetical protein